MSASELFIPKSTARDIYGMPFREGPRVVTAVPMKDGNVVFATNHENKTLQSLFEDFKLTKSKVTWLQENREALKTFDVNVDTLITAYSSNWNWKKSKAQD